jgi:KRAB domain-containing zinc finger protein
MKVTLRTLAAEPGHDLHNIIPSEREFKILEELLKPLLMIKQSSERLSADKPALHVVMCFLMNIMTLSQDQHFASKTEPYQAFVKSFETEMLKPNHLPDYGRNIMQYCVGNFLHPRFKGILLKTKTSRDYVPTKFNETIDFIKDIFTTHVPETEDMEVDSPSFLNRAMDESEWEQMPSFVTQVDTQSHYQALPRDIIPIEKDLDTWLKHTEPSDRTDIDIIAYWKEKADKMPLLAKVARTFFAMPVTSASSERLFSAAGNVVTSARTLLNSERAEQLIFIHDNYWLVEPTIKSMKIRTDRERGKERP